MAKNDNLKDFVTDVADAIREKKGTTDLINPQDFATEIRTISGGSESGGSTWRYFKVNDTTKLPSGEAICMIIKIGNSIFPHSGLATLAMTSFNTIYKDITAIGALPFKFAANGVVEEIDNDAITELAGYMNLTEITEAEFYDLTA